MTSGETNWPIRHTHKHQRNWMCYASWNWLINLVYYSANTKMVNDELQQAVIMHVLLLLLFIAFLCSAVFFRSLSRLTTFLSHVMLNERLSLFIACSEYPPKWCTYGAVWLSHGWRSVKLLPSWCILCTPYSRFMLSHIQMESSTGNCGNTGVEQIPKKRVGSKSWPWRRTFTRRSCQD